MLPSPMAIVTAIIVAFFVVLTVVRGPVDADYWWHLTTGRLIFETGSVPTIDPFSFAYDGPWAAHEWLGEVAIARLIDTVGWNVTAGLFGIATASAILLPAYAVHARGVRIGALLPFLAVAAYGTASYATVRPQVLSWLLLGLLLVLLISLRPEHRYRAWLVVPLMVVWSNVHGLYVVGLGVLAIYAIFTLFRRTRMASRQWLTVGMVLAATVSAWLTPAGPAGLLYPLRYLRQDDWGTAFIAEWQSIDVTDPRQWGFVTLIVCSVLLIRHLRLDWSTAVGILAIGGAIIAARNGPIAMVTSIPMLGLAMERWLAEHRPGPEPVTAQRQRRLAELTTGAIVIGATLVIVPGAAAGSAEQTFPTMAFDRLEERGADTRLLVDYDWAGYAINRIHEDGGEVFIDGRSDMYPRKVFEDYLAIRDAGSGWQDLIEDYGVEAIILRPSAPLVEAAQDADWCPAHADADSVLLLPCDAG